MKNVSVFAVSPLFDGNLSVTDDDMQKVSDTLDDVGIGIITQCSTTTDNFCFKYENSVLKLYVNGTLQLQTPNTEIVSVDSLLLESGDFLLLESGDKLLLE